MRVRERERAHECVRACDSGFEVGVERQTSFMRTCDQDIHDGIQYHMLSLIIIPKDNSYP